MEDEMRCRYKTILFDLDGTLLYTFSFHRKAFKRFFVKYYCFSKESDIDPYIGNSIQEIFEKLGVPPGKWGELQSRLNMFYSREVDDLIDELVFPDEHTRVLEVLRAEGYSLAIVSNSCEAFAMRLLKRKGLLGYFDFVSGDTNDAGDKAQRLRKIIERVRAAGDILYIGDIPEDIEMSSKAGIDSILFYSSLSWVYPYDYLSMKYKPTFICFCMNDILKILKEIVYEI